MKRLLILFLLVLSINVKGQIVADHSVVDRYDDIPANWIDSVKKMLFVIPGESHALAYLQGLVALETADGTYDIGYTTEPEVFTDTHLRISRTTWGDYDNATGWINDYGQEDWFTSALAKARTKAGLTHYNLLGIAPSAFGYAWCYDGDVANPTEYLTAMEEYIAYCSDSIDTKLFFTTSTIDDGFATGEWGYNRYLFNETIRTYVGVNSTRILFDYADILCYDDGSDTPNTATWDGHTFPTITTTNAGEGETGHIGWPGAVRLAKATWWLMARLAGWDGGNNYYVSTTGSDSNVGSLASPWATPQKAFNTAEAGDTVFFRGGTWYPTAVTGLDIAPSSGVGHNGTYNNWIVYTNYPGEVPIIDFSLLPATSGSRSGLDINMASYVEFKGIIFQRVLQTVDHQDVTCITYSHNNGVVRFENITTRYNGGAGLVITGIDTLYLVNCDSYWNCDTTANYDGGHPGGKADGFNITGGGAVTDTMKIAYISGCRAWANSDDGFDVALSKQWDWHDCWVWDNGKMEGDGTAYKLSSAHLYLAEKRKTYNNISAYNINGWIWANMVEEGYGIFDVLYNNTSYKDGIGMWAVAASEWDADLVPASLVAKNNLIYEPTFPPTPGYDPWQAIFSSGNYDVGPPDYVTLSNNSFVWLTGTVGGLTMPNPAFTITDDDFVSLDTAQLSQPRQADGSLPNITFGTLAVGSDLIDAGTDVGLAYNGAAPEIGYAEYGVASADSSLKYITAYSFDEQTGVAVIDTAAKTVDIEVEYGTDVTGLIATFSLSTDATAAVGAIPQVSGTTANNFTSPVTYVVTALDASTQNWTVTVTVESEPVPTVATVGTVSANYTAVTANVTGVIYSANGGTLTARGVCWSTTNTSPTTSDKHTTFTPYVGSFTDKIYGLRGGTTYYFRAYGTTSEGGTSYGDAISFTTPVHSISNLNGKIGKVNGKIGIVK